MNRFMRFFFISDSFHFLTDYSQRIMKMILCKLLPFLSILSFLTHFNHQ